MGGGYCSVEKPTFRYFICICNRFYTNVHTLMSTWAYDEAETTPSQNGHRGNSKQEKTQQLCSEFKIADLMDTILPPVPYTKESNARAAEGKLGAGLMNTQRNTIEPWGPSHYNPNLHNIPNHNNCMYIQWWIFAVVVSTNGADKYADQEMKKWSDGKLA